MKARVEGVRKSRTVTVVQTRNHAALDECSEEYGEKQVDKWVQKFLGIKSR